MLKFIECACSLGKNTLFSVNTKSVFVKQAYRYSQLLHFSSTAFGNRNQTHLAFILHLLSNSIHLDDVSEAIRVLTYISVCCVHKTLLAVELNTARAMAMALMDLGLVS